MKRLFYYFILFTFLFLNISYKSFAEEKVNASKQGSIRGRIIDTSEQTLPGASIYIEKLHMGVTSDINGYYTFSNLVPGTYTVKVSYIGYSPVELKITIPEGKTLEKNVVLNEGVELQEVVVGGAFQGQRRALSSQKNNLGITNIVSADQVGKFPDSNIGDALKRISGINVQYDQGEARFGQVRGTSAELSSVTINGNRIPSAEGETRNVQLDLIPADMIQSIEVNKVVTPDMDADAIGGSINLITKNSPYGRTIVATAGSGYNWVSDKAALNLGFTYGDRFFNDKLGIMLSASYQNNPAGSDDVEMAYEKDEDTGNVYLDEYEVRQYYVTRERQSYSLAMDWKINTNHKLDFKGIFNNRNDWENRYRHTYKYEDPNEYEVIYETKAGGRDQRNARLEQQRTMDFALGGEHLFGNLLFDWNASYAQAGEKRPNERYLSFKSKDNILMDTDWSDIRRPFMSPKTASDIILNSDNYKLDELTESFEDINEKDIKFSANFELPLTKGRFANKLKFGAKIVDKNKEKEVDFYEYSPTDEYKDDFMTEAMNNLLVQNRDGYMAGDRYRVGSLPDKEFVGRIDLTSNNWEKEEKLDEEAENFDAHETVTAGYVRFDQQLGKRWKLMAGLRLENTHVTYSGFIYDDGETSGTGEPSLTKTKETSQQYINLLPSFIAKWDVNDNFKLRAAFTNTIARPKYSNLVPNVIIDEEDIAFGNPDLKPTISYNFDLNGEYYFKGIGLVSAGIFYKKINDFIVDYRENNYMYNGHEYEELTKPINAGDANLFGVELAYQRDFGFIHPALRCIGLYGNYTYTYSKVKDFNFEGRENEDLRLPGSPEHTANLSLYFEKAGVSLRCSYNFASDFIDEVGEEAFYDRYYDKVSYMDLNASYTFGKDFKTTFYAEATNLLNQPLRYYQGTKDRSMQAEYYGVRVNAGVKIKF